MHSTSTIAHLVILCKVLLNTIVSSKIEIYNSELIMFKQIDNIFSMFKIINIMYLLQFWLFMQIAFGTILKELEICY